MNDCVGIVIKKSVIGRLHKRPNEIWESTLETRLEKISMESKSKYIDKLAPKQLEVSAPSVLVNYKLLPTEYLIISVLSSLLGLAAGRMT